MEQFERTERFRVLTFIRKIVPVLCAAVLLASFNVSHAWGKPRRGGASAVSKGKYVRFLKNILKLKIDPDSVRISKGIVKTGTKWRVLFFETKDGRRGVVVIDDQFKHLVASSIFEVRNGKVYDAVYEIAKKERLVPPSKAADRVLPMEDVRRFSWCVGDKNAPSLYVFVDPNCPYCRRELNELLPQVENGRLRLCLRWMIVHGKSSEDKAVEVECVRKKLGEMQALKKLLGEEDYEVRCTERERELARGRIHSSNDGALAVGMVGTPTVVVPKPDGRDGRVFIGYHPWGFYRVMLAKDR